MEKNVEIFNYQKMLALYLNDEEMVKETILFFREKGGEKIELMKQAWAEKNFKDLSFYSHALKGDSHNLCAKELASEAEKIELLAKDEADHDYDRELARIQKLFDDFLRVSELYI